MNRTIKVKRLYSLGQFKNISIEDEISDIPQELWTNIEVMKLLRKLQIIQVDSVYAQYVKSSGVVNKKLDTKKELEEYISLLDENRTTTLERVTEAVASITTKEQEEMLEKQPETEEETEV